MKEIDRQTKILLEALTFAIFMGLIFIVYYSIIYLATKIR